jgi:hypothetical protein
VVNSAVIGQVASRWQLNTTNYYKENNNLADWQVTATTIYCDAVDDDVTILVYKDLTAKCTGYDKYGQNLDSATTKLLKKKSKTLHHNLKCEGPLDFS